MDVPGYNETIGPNITYRGGNAFENHSKRLVGYAGTYDGVDVYVYHANASNKSKLLVCWLATALRANGLPFVLVGDFNCEPGDLVGDFALPAGVHHAHAGHTHNAMDWKLLGKTYDWAIHYGCTSVTVAKTGRTGVSDHLPILVTVTP